jgi:hypothetical protein
MHVPLRIRRIDCAPRALVEFLVGAGYDDRQAVAFGQGHAVVAARVGAHYRGDMLAHLGAGIGVADEAHHRKLVDPAIMHRMLSCPKCVAAQRRGQSL